MWELGSYGDETNDELKSKASWQMAWLHQAFGRVSLYFAIRIGKLCLPYSCQSTNRFESEVLGHWRYIRIFMESTYVIERDG